MSQIMLIGAVLFSPLIIVLSAVLMLVVIIVLIVYLQSKKPELLDFSEADKDAIAIEPVWESESAITELQKKQITRVVSSGAFRRMRDEDNK